MVQPWRRRDLLSRPPRRGRHARGGELHTNSPAARPNIVNAALTPNRRSRTGVENDDYGASVTPHRRRSRPPHRRRRRRTPPGPRRPRRGSRPSNRRSRRRPPTGRVLLGRNRQPRRHHPPSSPATLGNRKCRVTRQSTTHRRVWPFTKSMKAAHPPQRWIKITLVLSGIPAIIGCGLLFHHIGAWAYLTPLAWWFADLPPLLIHNARVSRLAQAH
jgi:hypothetical protein